MDLAGVFQKVPAKLAGVKFALCQVLYMYLTSYKQVLIRFCNNTIDVN